jgi:hypothetical protein
MDPQLRSRAEARLRNAAEQLGLSDPRPPYRERLRVLREQHPEAFSRAIAHYETDVLPALAEASDPLAVWTAYGGFLARLTEDGNAVRVDASGRSQPFRPPITRGELVLFLPDNAAADVLVMAMPETASPAQAATVDLLVKRKLALGS